MRRFFASFDVVLCAIGRWLIQPLGTRIAVVSLLSIHVGLLAYSATRHSPTHLEPAFLASGISHWQFGRFELYRVNPPLPRMIAALPVLAVGCETDWRRYYDGPGTRAEFPIGADFIRANGPRSIPLFVYSRWACIPFSLIGGYFAFCWANELYGSGAGLMTLFLWTCEPNLLAHAELLTPDCACWSFGIVAGYSFWRWLKQPTWGRAMLAGLTLGLAELTKLTWLILIPLWPALWLAWLTIARLSPYAEGRTSTTNTSPETTTSQPPRSRNPKPKLRCPTLAQLVAILLMATYTLNLGYGFDGTCTRLKNFTFVSSTFSGHVKTGTPGNRFSDTLLAELPVPLPRQYILGIDTQNKDLEHYGYPSYLRGQWRYGGWWYYYIYGLLVKVPCSLWGMFCAVVLLRLCDRKRPLPFRDEMVLLAPAVIALVAISSQTEFNHHLRYVFPALALTTVFVGQLPCILSCVTSRHAAVTTLFALFFALSCGQAFPNHLAYFNEFAGGPSNGHKHLLGSSLDWGQDLLELFDWTRGQASLTAIEMSTLYDPLAIAPNNAKHLCVRSPLLSDQHPTVTSEAHPAYVAISVSTYLSHFANDAVLHSAAEKQMSSHQRVGHTLLLLPLPDPLYTPTTSAVYQRFAPECPSVPYTPTSHHSSQGATGASAIPTR